MPETAIQFEGGDILANLEDRTITGLLIPFGEEGRTNVGRFTVEAGSIELPADPSVISINTDHVRSANVGRATRVWEEARGVMATFAIARTPAGDAALADAISPTGKRRKLSGEFGPAVLAAGKLVAGHAALWGSALVGAGAFPSAMVLAQDTPEDVAASILEDLDDGTGDSPSTIDLDLAVEELPSTITATTPAGDSATYTTEAEPAEETNPESEPTVPTPAPVHTLAGAPETPSALDQAYDLGAVFASIAQVKGGISDADSLAVLAALSDITTTGLAGDGTANSILQPQWVGKVWQGKTYARRFIHLATLGTGISIGGKKGYKLAQGTALVKAWAGNKVELPSGTATTSLVSSTLRKYGYAVDIAREFYDLDGGAEVVAAFIQGVVDSYAKVSDLDALGDIIRTAAWSGAGAFGSNITRVIAPAVYPGVAGANYGGAIGQLIQGISAVQDADDTPSFAIVNAAAWNQLIYTPKDMIPEYVTFGFNTDGTGVADGKVQVVKAPDSAFTLGANVFTTNPVVVVGAKQAIEFDEIGETPIQLDALDIARGGIDKAVIGYLQTFVVRPESIVMVGVKNA
jgi:hypothetical protein